MAEHLNMPTSKPASTRKRVIVYYISGHGYGHFTRSVTLMKELLHQNVCDVIIVRTRVSTKLFEELFPTTATSTPSTTTTNDNSSTLSCLPNITNNGMTTEYNNGTIIRSECKYDLDAGTIQSSPLDVEPIQTLELHLSQIKTLDLCLKEEQEFLKQFIQHSSSTTCTIGYVLCDASPIGIAAAHELNIPSALVSNFDWHSILQEFLNQCKSNTLQKTQTIVDTDFISKCQEALDITKDLYSKASILIRPRGAVPSTVPYTRIIDVPWMCPTLLQSDITSSGESYLSCRERILDYLFPERLKIVTKETSDSCEYRIVLVTFGGQAGKAAKNKVFTVENSAADELNGTTDETNTTFSSKLRLGFIFATRDAEEQVQIQIQHGCGNNSSAGKSSYNSVAMTSSKARSLIFGNENKGSIAELTKMSDVVLCKPGYGTVCETVASNTTMVYIHREPKFFEEKYLVKDLASNQAWKMSRKDFEARNWYSTICQALLKAQDSSTDMNDDNHLMGANVISRILKEESSFDRSAVAVLREDLEAS